MPKIARICALIFTAIPFAFGLIRAIQTGRDVRYLWVATAGWGGAMLAATFIGASRRSNLPMTASALFGTSALLAVLAAMALGTHFGPGILVVAAGFACCFTAGALLNVLVRPR